MSGRTPEHFKLGLRSKTLRVALLGRRQCLSFGLCILPSECQPNNLSSISLDKWFNRKPRGNAGFAAYIKEDAIAMHLHSEMAVQLLQNLGSKLFLALLWTRA
jgi:hypothetical protein